MRTIIITICLWLSVECFAQANKEQVKEQITTSGDYFFGESIPKPTNVLAEEDAYHALLRHATRQLFSQNKYPLTYDRSEYSTNEYNAIYELLYEKRISRAQIKFEKSVKYDKKMETFVPPQPKQANAPAAAEKPKPKDTAATKPTEVRATATADKDMFLDIEKKRKSGDNTSIFTPKTFGSISDTMTQAETPKKEPIAATKTETKAVNRTDTMIVLNKQDVEIQAANENHTAFAYISKSAFMKDLKDAVILFRSQAVDFSAKGDDPLTLERFYEAYLLGIFTDLVDLNSDMKKTMEKMLSEMKIVAEPVSIANKMELYVDLKVTRNGAEAKNVWVMWDEAARNHHPVVNGQARLILLNNPKKDKEERPIIIGPLLKTNYANSALVKIPYLFDVNKVVKQRRIMLDFRNIPTLNFSVKHQNSITTFSPTFEKVIVEKVTWFFGDGDSKTVVQSPADYGTPFGVEHSYAKMDSYTVVMKVNDSPGFVKARKIKIKTLNQIEVEPEKVLPQPPIKTDSTDKTRIVKAKDTAVPAVNRKSNDPYFIENDTSIFVQTLNTNRSDLKSLAVAIERLRNEGKIVVGLEGDFRVSAYPKCYVLIINKKSKKIVSALGPGMLERKNLLTGEMITDTNKYLRPNTETIVLWIQDKEGI